MGEERSRLREELARLNEMIATLEAQRSALGDAVVEAALAPLRARVAALASGERSVAVAGDVRDSIIITGDGRYDGPLPRTPAAALRIYRRVTAVACSHLPLRGVDIQASDPTCAQPLNLAQVYVALDTRTPAPTEHAEGPMKRPGAEQESRPLSALEAAAANRSMVLLGDPGGGKSTFVRHLAYCLATGQADALAGWPDPEALPVLVLLRDLARSLAGEAPRAEPRHLWDFLLTWLEAKRLGFAADPLERELEKGRAVVLLDGLDEVPSQEMRSLVRDAVAAFVKRYPRNRYLVTCRTLSYQDPAGQLPGFPRFELAPFDEAKIDRFIEAWYDELLRVGTVRAGEVEGLARKLKAAVRRPDLWPMASNPLLLTVMALVHTHKGRLPDARALLYEDVVDILLWRWEEIKAGAAAEAPRLRQLLLQVERMDVDLKRVLWDLAYRAHAEGGAGTEDLADIGQAQLERALAGLHPEGSLKWARAVVDSIKLRAGLLLERAPEVFTFPHRTFQEYLAGGYLSTQAQFAREAAQLAQAGAHWREVILLAVGRLVYLGGDTDKPLALVGELCPEEALPTEAGWRKAWLAGDVLREVGRPRVRDSVLGRDLWERVRHRLVALLRGGRLTPVERAAAGDTLAGLGDPRFREDAWHLPDEALLGFVEVPAGPFLMGTPEEDIPTLLERFGGERWWYERETPQHEVDLPTYYVARFPVTVAQFQAFVQASGPEPQDADSLRGVPNHPVRYVSWYEAVAYCEWLTEVLRAWEGTPEPLGRHLREGGWVVTLPSEAEWEKAARGTDGRIYPWGHEPDPDRANYAASEIGTTSAVGCFPGGASPYVIEDVSGNVWEWTRSLWGMGGTLEFDYPYDAEDGREDMSAGPDVYRVVRGGAFGSYGGYVRCAVRSRYSPFVQWGNPGFRVVAAPFSRGAAVPRRNSGI